MVSWLDQFGPGGAPPAPVEPAEPAEIVITDEELALVRAEMISAVELRNITWRVLDGLL